MNFFFPFLNQSQQIKCYIKHNKLTFFLFLKKKFIQIKKNRKHKNFYFLIILSISIYFPLNIQQKKIKQQIQKGKKVFDFLKSFFHIFRKNFERSQK